TLSFDGKVLVPGTGNIHGIIFGDGEKPDVLGPSEPATSRVTEASANLLQYDLAITAEVTDADTEELLAELTLTGVPQGATVYGANGAEIVANADGSFTLTGDLLTTVESGHITSSIQVVAPAGA